MARGESSQVGTTVDGDSPSDPLMARAEERVGRTLHEKWRLDVLLGVGGTAAVYAATHRNGSRAAVKVLHPEASSNAFVRDRFLWEGYVANAVGHEAAVRVIDDDVADDGSLFLVTELLDGETLEERRARFGGKLPQAEVLLVADQLLEMLIAAHGKGIVHRDVKPENVFLTRAGRIKVLDFGIARHGDGAAATALIRSGTMIGTPSYMAPEHARGQFDELDERSDLWSCGATLFRLLSGRGVHEGETIEEEIANARDKPALPLATVAPEVHAAVARLVDRALAFEKEKRWTDASEMRAAVREAYFDCVGSPIGSAAALTLGGVPDRTLPRVGGAIELAAPWGPSSIRAVAMSHHDSKPPAAPAPARHKALVGALAVLAMVAVGFGSAALERMANGQGRRASAAEALVCPAPPPPVVQLAPLSVPDMLAEPPAASAPAASVSARRFDPPPVRWVPIPARTHVPVSTAVAVTAPAPVETSAVMSPISSPASTGPSRDCDPPYVVDGATGKQRWKLECL
jgi:serine/threonine-protein kinase